MAKTMVCVRCWPHVSQLTTIVFTASLLLFASLCAVFEFIGLYRVFVANEKLSAVQPMFSLISGAVHFQDRFGFLFVAGILAVIRLTQLAHFNSKAAWAITAATHVFEACWFTLLIVVLNPKNLEQRYSLDLFNDQRTQGVVIFAIVLFNALLFSLCWLLAPFGSPKAAANKNKRE